jgi:hypothetical protein
MSKRLYYLADGTLRTVTAGRFRGDDEVAGKTITQQIVVRDDGQAGAVGAPVHMDPDNPEGPLVIHYDSAAGQKALSIVDDATKLDVFEINSLGFVLSTKGMSTTTFGASSVSTGDLDVDGDVTGEAFDTGTWVPDASSVPVPTANTVVTRNAGTETVSVSNLRVGRRTAQPKSFVNGQLVNDPNGTLAGDGLNRGLYFDQGEFNDELRCIPPLSAQDAGGCLWAQSVDDKRIYRFGFDPEKIDDNDGLHFTDNRGAGSPRQISLKLGPSDGTGALGTFENDGVLVEIAKGNLALDCHSGTIRTLKIECRDIAADSSNGLRFKNDADVSHLTVENDGTMFLQDPDDDATVLQANSEVFTVNSTDVNITGTTACVEVNATGDVNAPFMELKSTHSSKSQLFVGRSKAGVRNFTLYNTGELKFLHSFAGTDEEATVHTSIVTDDSSVYVGSSRYSYDRTNHVVALHRLKQGHIPIYLQGLGFTANDLPAAHTHDDMSVRKWLVHARTHFSDEDIGIRHLFPAANTGDWVVIDAPVPALQAWANGADADISTLETEVDAAEGRLDALEAIDNATQVELDVEKARIDAILNLSVQDLDTFREIELAYKAADSSIETTVTNLTSTASADRDDIRSDFAAADALKADIDDPTFTTNVTTPLIHTSQIMSQNSHLKLGSQHTNDLNLFLNGQETLQLTRSGTEVRYQAHGGSGQHRFMNKIFGNADVDIAGNYLISGSQVAMANLSDGSSYSTTVQRNVITDALQADIDSNEAVATADRLDIRADYIAADNVVSAAQLVVTNLLDGRLDDLEAVDYGTQAELNAVEAAALAGRQAIQSDVDSNEAVATADRLDIRADYIAADSVVTTNYIAADSAVSAAQLVVTNLLDGRLDDLEAVDYGTQAELNAVEAAALAGRQAIQSDVDSNEAVATADRLDIRADYIAADSVVTTNYIAADSAVSAAQLVVTNLLDGRLDDLEAVDYGTQAELNAVEAALDSRLDVLEAIDNATQTELNVEKARIAALEAIDNATQTELNVEKARIATLEGIDNATQAELNVEKARIATLEGVDNATQAELNVEKARIAALESTDTTHGGLHDQHTASLALKINTTGHQQMNGRLTIHHSGNGEVANAHADDLQVYFYNDAGITIGCPEGKIGTLAFSDQNKADRNQIRAYSTVRDTRNIGMHFLSNQAETAVPSMSVTDQLVGINNAQPSYALDVNGSLGFSVEDQGSFTTTQTLSAACTIWKLNPTAAPSGNDVICYLPAPADNTGRFLTVLNVNDTYRPSIKTVSNGSFAGLSNGSYRLANQKHQTFLCDGTSWYPAET